MAQFLWICLGGAVGTGARYLMGTWAAKTFGTVFPYGTIAVNVIGCFFIVVVTYLGLTRGVITPTVRLALTTGVMGGFTTYSTFNYETFGYLRQGAWGLAAANFGITAVGCMLAAGLAQVFAETILGGPHGGR